MFPMCMEAKRPPSRLNCPLRNPHSNRMGPLIGFPSPSVKPSESPPSRSATRTVPEGASVLQGALCIGISNVPKAAPSAVRQIRTLPCISRVNTRASSSVKTAAPTIPGCGRCSGCQPSPARRHTTAPWWGEPKPAKPSNVTICIVRWAQVMPPHSAGSALSGIGSDVHEAKSRIWVRKCFP